MKIAISTESTADLTKELIEEFDLKTIAYEIQLGDRCGLDGEITSGEIIEFVNQTNTLAKTAAVNEYRFNEYFENLLKDYDAVIHFSLSSELSVTYNNGVRAAKNFKNVYMVDTRSLSTGIGLLAIYAKTLVEQGLDAEEIYQACLRRVPYIQASFELKRLDYLHKGGRCSGLALFGANLLKIRPQIIVSNGKMIPGKKYRGKFDHVVKNYCQDVLDTFNNPDLTLGFVTYTTADDEIIKTAKQYLLDRGFKRICVTRAGGTITSHCGEDCLGILYINDGK
ncbi:MAG: DegV family protein [Clostridiales bacterium]|nr:DegV family protein [Clostridiales bacterium]